MRHEGKRLLRHRRMGAALSAAAIVHVAILCVLCLRSNNTTWQSRADPTEVSIWIEARRIARPDSVERHAGARHAISDRSPSSEGPASPAETSPNLPVHSTSGANDMSRAAAIGASLRRSVGCAEPDAPWMTDADRDQCRHRLASGAEATRPLDGISAEKLAYFDAVVASHDDWLSGRDAGHGPGFGCEIFVGPGARRQVPPHALKLGPCLIEPPRGSLDTDVDVLPPGETGPIEIPPPFLTTRASHN